MKYKQGAILFTMLVIPVLIYAFFKIFGSHEFLPLPVLAPDSSINCAPTEPSVHQAPAIEGMNAQGKSVSPTAMKGAAYIVAFVDMQCETPTCEATSMSLYRVQERFKTNPYIKILSYTTAPATDSTEVLGAYLEKYKAMPNKWLALRTTAVATKDMGTCGYGLIKGTSLAHSTWLALVDEKRQIRGLYDTSIREEVDRLLIEAKLLSVQQGVRR